MRNLLFLISCVVIAACTPGADEKSAGTGTGKLVNVDSLNAIFISSWNSKDSVAALAIMADNAVVMNDSLIHTGKNEIASNWIRSGIKVISNINTVSLIKEANETLAYDGGTYSLDLTIPDGPSFKEEGHYTIVWKKNNDSDWKLTLVHIENVTRIPKGSSNK